MKVRTNLDEKELWWLAKDLGLELHNYVEWNPTHKQFTLKPRGERFKRKGRTKKKIHSVCLHGYTAFMCYVLKHDKLAKFKTALSKKEVNIDNIDDMYEELWYYNIGSAFEPFLYGESCFCDEQELEFVYNLLQSLKAELTTITQS